MIVDASVAVKLLAPEDGSEISKAILISQNVIAPDLLLAEVSNAMWSKVRRGILAAPNTRLDQLPLFIAEFIPSVELMDDALRLAIELGHPVYDCFYLALAIARDVPLVTADARFLVAIAGTGHQSRVTRLSDWR